MYPKITLILLAATACGCSPLREMHSDRRTDIRIADSTLTERIRQEFERQLATLRQTVVEFYPPVQWPPSSEDEPILPPDTLNPLLPPSKIPATFRPAVRRTSTPRPLRHTTELRTLTASPAAASLPQRVTTNKPHSRKGPIRPARCGSNGRLPACCLCC